MKLQYIGAGPILLNASWTEYNYDLEANVTKGLNYGQVDPGMVLEVEDDLVPKLLSRGDFALHDWPAPPPDVPAELSEAHVAVEEAATDEAADVAVVDKPSKKAKSG